MKKIDPLWKPILFSIKAVPLTDSFLSRGTNNKKLSEKSKKLSPSTPPFCSLLQENFKGLKLVRGCAACCQGGVANRRQEED
jgi:hypothetical protein